MNFATVNLTIAILNCLMTLGLGPGKVGGIVDMVQQRGSCDNDGWRRAGLGRDQICATIIKPISIKMGGGVARDFFVHVGQSVFSIGPARGHHIPARVDPPVLANPQKTGVVFGADQGHALAVGFGELDRDLTKGGVVNHTVVGKLDSPVVRCLCS